MRGNVQTIRKTGVYEPIFPERQALGAAGCAAYWPGTTARTWSRLARLGVVPAYRRGRRWRFWSDHLNTWVLHGGFRKACPRCARWMYPERGVAGKVYFVCSWRCAKGCQYTIDVDLADAPPAIVSGYMARQRTLFTSRCRAHFQKEEP